MWIIDNVLCADTFPADGAMGAAQLVARAGSNGGYFTIATNDAYAQLAYAPDGVGALLEWTDPFHVTVGNGILAPGTRGIRFKNYVAGRTAVVSAALSEPKEPPVQLTAGGSSTPSVLSMQLISQQTVTSATNTITFASIPQTFQSLKLIVHGRSALAGNFDDVGIRFNADSAANYDFMLNDASGPPANTFATSSGLNQGRMSLGGVPGATGTLLELGTIEALIPDYANAATTDKSLLSSARALLTVGGVVQWFQRDTGGLWHPAAAAAITQLDIFPASASAWSSAATQQTKAWLYGL